MTTVAAADRATRLAELAAHFEPADLELLLRIGDEREIPAGTCLLEAGDAVETVFLVLDGAVHHRAGRHGRNTAVAFPGGFAGDVALYRRTAAGHDLVVGDGPARVLAVEASTVWGLTHRSAGLAHRWMRSVICRLEVFQRRTLAAGRPLRERLAALLLEARMPARECPVVELSQRCLADLIGVTRPALTRAMAELREAGSITTGYRCIEVVDGDALERIVGHRDGPEPCVAHAAPTFVA